MEVSQTERFSIMQQEGLILIEDTRNKIGSHENVKRFCDKHGIEIIRKKLDYGDYMLESNPSVSIDTKQDLQEVAANLMNRNDSARFWREVRGAAKAGIHLIVLVEQHGISTISDVCKWKSPYNKVTGRMLLDEMIRCEMSYGVRWEFCDKRSTGKRVIEILMEHNNVYPFLSN